MKNDSELLPGLRAAAEMFAYSVRKRIEERIREIELATISDTRTLILAKLSDEDFDQFMAARIPYSGSTGKHHDVGHGEYAPYIATYVGCIQAILTALNWERVWIKIAPGQWIIHRDHSHRKVDPPILEIACGEKRIVVEAER